METGGIACLNSRTYHFNTHFQKYIENYFDMIFKKQCKVFFSLLQEFIFSLVNHTALKTCSTRVYEIFNDKQ